LGDGSSRGGRCFGIKRSLGGEEVATEWLGSSIGVEMVPVTQARSLLVKGGHFGSLYGVRGVTDRADTD